MSSGLARLSAGVALAALLAAAGPAPQPDDVVAQVGSITMTVADVQTLLAHVDPAVREQLLKTPAALTELVRNQLVRQELLDQARAKKWDADPDVAYRANQAHDTVIVESYLASLTRPDPSYPSDEDVQAAYEANKTQFVKPREYRLAQIFIAVPPGAPKSANDDAQKKLREIKQSLAHAHGYFADAARRSSQDKTSAEHGGETGWAREDQLLPVIKDAVAGLPENGVSDPIRAVDGWHLVKLLETRPSTTASLAEVKDTLVRSLRQQKAADNARAYIQKMQAKQPPALNEIVLSHLAAH